MIQILENWKASRHHAREQAAERRALEQRRDKLATRQMALECQLIETQTRMATEQANPLWGDPQFRRGFKSMLQSEPDFPGRAKLMEGLDYFDTIVDPFDAVRGENGELWDQIASAMYGASEPFLGLLGFRNELELRMARNLSRLLCKENPWAICGIKNRINYTIGTGHTYQIVAKKGQEIDPTIIAAIQKVLDAWTERNKWPAIQKDCFFREDMDGECILRIFETDEGLQVRFVEPWQLTTPAAAMDPAHAWGVQVDLEDSQNVIAYWIDSKSVDPEQIQHRKRNVMRNVRRGIPTFYPCRFHLRRAENLLKNMGLVAELQASIAIIRKWPSGATGAQMGAFQASASQAQYTSATTSERRSFEKFRPGSILDVKAGYDYDYPGAGIDASNYGEVLACELRAVSSRLVMPEWMLSSDASNANYASTMVSEGSCVKEFEALSGDQEAHDLEILWRVLRFAGRKINSPFPVETLDAVDIQVGTPNIIARDRLQEVQADQLLQTAGVLSPQTMADRNDLDYQQEMSNIEDHCDRFGGRPATLAGVMPIEPHGPLGDDGTPPSPVWNPGAASDDRPLSPNGPMNASDYQTGGIPKDLVMGENPPIDTGPRARKGLPTERTDDLAFFALNAQGSESGDTVGSLHEGGPGSGPHPGVETRKFHGRMAVTVRPDYGDEKEVTVHANPTRNEVTGLAKRHGELRSLVNVSSGDHYVFPANAATHEEVSNGLGSNQFEMAGGFYTHLGDSKTAYSPESYSQRDHARLHAFAAKRADRYDIAEALPASIPGSLWEGGPGSGPHPGEKAMERTRKSTNATLKAREASSDAPDAKSGAHSDAAAERAGDASNYAIHEKHANAAKAHVQAAGEHTAAMDAHLDAAGRARAGGDEAAASNHEKAAKLHERAANAHITASNGHALIHTLSQLEPNAK